MSDTNTKLPLCRTAAYVLGAAIAMVCYGAHVLAEDCEPKRACDATRDCSVNHDTRDCEPHWNCPDCKWYDAPCHARRLGCETNKATYKSSCEAQKAAQNKIYEANKPVCEAQKAAEKLDCERIKFQMKKACELGLDGPFSCSPGEVMSQLRSSPQDGLTDFDTLSGAITTPIKKLGGQLSWRETACQTSGAVAKPYRNSQRSSDGFCTVDVKLASFPIDALQMPAGNHYIRIEALPGGKMANTCKDRTISTGETIQFGGPIKIDKHFPGHRWLEVHVADDFALVNSLAPADRNGSSSGKPYNGGTVQQSADEPRSGGSYVIRKGDNLAQIAGRAYGRQSWPKIYRANSSAITSGDPDLIYPGVTLKIP